MALLSASFSGACGVSHRDGEQMGVPSGACTSVCMWSVTAVHTRACARVRWAQGSGLGFYSFLRVFPEKG